MGYMWQPGVSTPVIPLISSECSSFKQVLLHVNIRVTDDYYFSLLRAEYFQMITKAVQLLTPSNWTYFGVTEMKVLR